MLAPIDEKVLSGMLSGGTIIPWGAWAVPLSNWILGILSCFLFFLFAGSLIRRQYVDIEALNFPLANAVAKVAELGSKGGRVADIWKSRPFWAGMLVSFAVGIGMSIENIAPTFKRISPVVDLTGLALIQRGPLTFGFEPWYIGFGYIQTYSASITTVISFLILMLIIPNILVATGQIHPLEPGSNRSYESTGLRFNLANPSIFAYPYSALCWGILFTMAIYPIFVHRRVLIESLSAIFRKIPKEIEEKEALSYRCLWLGTLIFALFWIASLVISNVPVPYAILIFILTTLFYLGWTRMRGETGGIYGGYGHNETPFIAILQWISNTTGLTAASKTSALSFMHLGSFYGMTRPTRSIYYAAPMPNILDSYALGDRVKASNKGVFIGMLIAAVINIPLTLMLTLWWYYTFGGKSTFLGSGWLGGSMLSIRESMNVIETGTTALPWAPAPNQLTMYMFILGIVLTVAMYMARMRYGWFIFTPVGILMGVYGGIILWTPFIIAIILRWLTFRIGGVELYEKTGMPVAAGLMFGVGLAVVLVGLIKATMAII